MSNVLVEKLASYGIDAIVTVAAGMILALFFFSFQLMRYGKEIKKLNNFETIAKLAHFAGQNEDSTRAFGKAAMASDRAAVASQQVREELEGLRGFLRDLQAKFSEYNADAITNARLEEDGSLATMGASKTNGSAAPANLDALFRGMMDAWADFTEMFVQKLKQAKISPDMRRIGRMTYELTDRRRKNPLPTETADLITALAAQYRGFIARQNRKPEWLTPAVHDSFIQLVKTAIKELERHGKLPPPVAANSVQQPMSA
jgi:hypothetical protein